MLAVVTGGTGCVGRNIIEVLKRNNWDICALVRSTSDISRLIDLDIDIKICDLQDYKSLIKTIPYEADVIFHAAANLSQWNRDNFKIYEDNVATTSCLISATLKNKVSKFIFTSTGATNLYQNINETNIHLINNPYVRTKRWAEILIERAVDDGLDAVIVKPAAIIGKYDYNNYSKIFNYLKNPYIPKLVFPGGTEFCYTEDVAKAHEAAYFLGKTGKQYNLKGASASWLEVFQKITELLKVKKPKSISSFYTLYSTAYLMEKIAILTEKKPLVTREFINLIYEPKVEAPKSVLDGGNILYINSKDIDEMLKTCYNWMLKTNLIKI
jgi:nucleoside-diphosphate-sugar epimerase